MQALKGLDIPLTVNSLLAQGEFDLLHSLDQLHACELGQSDGGAATATLRRCLQNQPKPWPAWAFLGYYRLGSWLLGGGRDEPSDMVRLSQDVCRAIARQPTAPTQITFGDTSHASEGLWRQLTDLFQEGGEFIDDLEAPDPHQLRRWSSSLNAARSWIEAADPDLHALMQSLQGLVIPAQPGPLARSRQQSFGGATCFFFRGATILNASGPTSTARTVERLVHEYAHAELFVLGQDEPLCLNSDKERHDVLIRPDPRPMNGILHSLYVVSRVAETLTKLPAARNHTKNLEEIDSDEVSKILGQQLRFGESSLKAIEDHAKLTPKGDLIVSIAIQRLVAAETAG
jgi:hypothetical protein